MLEINSQTSMCKNLMSNGLNVKENRNFGLSSPASGFTLLLQKIFPKYSLCPLIQVAKMLFIDGSKTAPLVTFAPSP